MLSIATDYAASTGCPEPALRQIAGAGFSHIHWCHHWNGDFLYQEPETAAIERWLAELDLALLDVHGSAGEEKHWGSALEYERRAGIELVRNRMDFAARLGAEVVVMHPPGEPENASERDRYWATLGASLDGLQPLARERGLRIALENLGNNNFGTIERVFERYGPDFVGLCYDSGHGHMTGNGLDRLEGMIDRLIAVHLHDNHGEKDEHLRPFSGTVDWERLADLIAASAYRGPISLEVGMGGHPGEEEDAFLARAFEAGTKLTEMVDARRSG